jgi:hypothetical protein
MHYADPYAAPGRWYKGNLHTHTTASDGQLPPAEVVARYQQCGYDFLALTDHNKVVDPAPLQAATSLTLIPGFEWGFGAAPHILCLGVRQVYNGSYQDVLDATRALGGMNILCHPNWVREDLWPPDVMAGLRYYAGIEIYNHVISRLEGRALATDDWDLLLSGGHRVWGYANEDAHRPTDIGHCFNMALAPACTVDNLLYSLDRGRCYASTGLLFTEIGVHGDAVNVALSEQAQIRFVGPGGQVLAASSARQASYRPQGEVYVRVEAETAQGRCVWSQPFWKLNT